MTAPFAIVDIKGLMPSVNPVNARDVYALAGRNYAFTSLGPKSMYGNRLLLPHPLGRPEHVQGFRLKLVLGDRVFIMTGDSILEWDEYVGGFRVLYVTPNTLAAPHRWTWGFLNNVLYFCHPRTGILEYDLATNRFGPVVGPGVPSDAVAIGVNNGRLIAVSTTVAYWSAPSNGRDFEPKLAGAGFQRLSERVSGDFIMVTTYSKGFLTWMTGGVMRSEFTGDVETYRHRAVNIDYRPINSFCTVQLDEDTAVILDERGLFQTRGESPTPFAPMFNEFLGDYIRRYNLRAGQNIRLEWDSLQRLMYVSVSLSEQSAIYEKAFVLYAPLDKWGQFNDRHYGLLPGIISFGPRADDYFCYVDEQGRVRLWQEVPSREVLPAGGVNLFYPLVQKQSQPDLNDDGWVVSSSFKFAGFDDTTLNQRAGFYAVGGTTPAVPSLTGLNAFLNVGYIRYTGSEVNDQLSEILQVKIANVLSREEQTEFEDYNTVPPDILDEDWNQPGDAEDYGLMSLNYINHRLKVIGTNDGRTTFVEKVPELVRFTPAARYYSCSVTGIWHIIQVAAVDVGENFLVQSIELTGADAGRLV